LKAYKSDKVKSGEFVGQKMIYPSSSGLSNKNGIWSIKKGYENHPVVDVTWYGAVTFANFYGLRLPTEAEWEFIAKGGRANDKYVFSGSDNLYNTGVYEGNSNFDSATVGSKGPTNILGVNDMSGNVWEWCNDWYTPNYNSVTPSNPRGPRSGTTKLIRGGSYSEGEWEARVTNRAYKTPATHANNIGFRCAK
jgi:formylglycine-generating enzyme required for sulfatase activity